MIKKFFITLIIIISLVSLGGSVNLHLDGSESYGHLHEGYTFSLSMAKRASHLDIESTDNQTYITNDAPVLIQEDTSFISSLIITSFSERAPPV